MQHLRRSPLLRRDEKKSLKPILGCELYLCRTTITASRQRRYYKPLPGLAENEAGYRNLVRLTSEAALHGSIASRVSLRSFCRSTRKAHRLLRLPRRENQNLMAGKYDQAKRTLANSGRCSVKATSSSRCRTTVSSPTKRSASALQDGARARHPIVATNDSHYVAADDSRAHEILLCVQTAGSMNDPSASSSIRRSSTSVRRRDVSHFAERPDVCSNTMQFVDRCNLKPARSTIRSPTSSSPRAKLSSATSKKCAAKGCANG